MSPTQYIVLKWKNSIHYTIQMLLVQETLNDIQFIRYSFWQIDLFSFNSRRTYLWKAKKTQLSRETLIAVLQYFTYMMFLFSTFTSLSNKLSIVL